MLRLQLEIKNEIVLRTGIALGKKSSISDLIGRPQYTAFKANAPPLISFRFITIYRVPAWMITSETRIILQKHTFKNTSLRQTGFLCPIFRNLGQFEAKCFIDNTIFI